AFVSNGRIGIPAYRAGISMGGVVIFRAERFAVLTPETHRFFEFGIIFVDADDLLPPGQGAGLRFEGLLESGDFGFQRGHTLFEGGDCHYELLLAAACPYFTRPRTSSSYRTSRRSTYHPGSGT